VALLRYDESGLDTLGTGISTDETNGAYVSLGSLVAAQSPEVRWLPERIAAGAKLSRGLIGVPSLSYHAHDAGCIDLERPPTRLPEVRRELGRANGSIAKMSQIRPAR
jgi:hypothetical protein